jgi:hypothetical protein
MDRRGLEAYYQSGIFDEEIAGWMTYLSGRPGAAGSTWETYFVLKLESFLLQLEIAGALYRRYGIGSVALGPLSGKGWDGKIGVKPTTALERAACDAYKALVKEFDGIQTGRTEAGTNLLENRKTGEIWRSFFITHTAKENEDIVLPGLHRATSPAWSWKTLFSFSGWDVAGYIHTHPSEGRVSDGDLGYLRANKLTFGFMTDPVIWGSTQIIKFDRYGTEWTIDCR